MVPASVSFVRSGHYVCSMKNKSPTLKAFLDRNDIFDPLETYFDNSLFYVVAYVFYTAAVAPAFYVI